jgi:cell surface protein SprA
MLRREFAIDTATSEVIFRETVGGVDVRVPTKVALTEYVAQRRQVEFRRIMAEEAQKPPTNLKRDDLGELISTITQIQIPIPPNPIFSIFGKPEINLKISGAVDIKAGFRNTKSDYTTISRLDQSRNEPDFSQDVQVNVNGTIGDKLNILADWNTKRTFEYENQLKIKYTGYEDEIVRNVEAGNVSLQTPSSFIGSSQALFGVKAQFQAGPLTLTALASQKKGQIKEVAVSGGSKEQTFEFRAFEYATNHYFVDTSYIPKYEPYYRTDPATVDGNIQIVEEEVWVLRQGTQTEGNDRLAIGYIDLAARGNGYNESLREADPDPGRIEIGPVVRLDRSQYELAGDGYIGVLSLNTNVGDQQFVGISYRRADGTQFGELTRDVGTDSAALARPIILKLVRPKNLLSTGPRFQMAWKMLLKNVYPIPGIGRNLKEQGFSLDILRRIPGGQDENSILGDPLLRVTLMDQYNADKTAAPNGDGQFDFRPGRTINQARAEIIFPSLRPFDTGIKEWFAAKGTVVDDTSQYLYPEVYDTTQTFSQQSLRNRYVISGKASGEATSKYSLGFNVVEGSVQVLLDGQQLTLNRDYTVDYIIGEVVIKNERALVPGANLQIKYEQNDLFQLASKTLLGARGDLALSPKTLLGFTLMNLNQETLSDKVRIGEEPNSNTIFGVDGSTSFELPLLTRVLDALPLLATREMSTVKISGEAAYMSPDPNTKKSTIPSDGGQGIAYIDDFEGIRRTIPIGVSYTSWFLSSPLADAYWFPGVADTVKMFSKAKMTWFNILPSDVLITDVYPKKQVGSANQQLTVLDLRYYPTTRGQFNYGTNLSSTLTPQRNWGGIMKPLSASAVNLTKENIGFIEIWLRVDRVPADKTAKLIIDLGVISEDVIPNRKLDSEDLVLSSFPNQVLNEGEDIGLDMLTDDQERARYAALTAAYPEMVDDPSGDNYAFDNSSQYETFLRINGSQNNANGPSGRIPDTEDLNSNGIVDLANSYLQYEVPLDTTPGMNRYIVGGGNDGWYQYRIPIADSVRMVGSPTAENVESIRLSFANVSDTLAVRIAAFDLVGNQWQKVAKDLSDTSFQVSVVSIEENYPRYQSPPGVVRERDRSQAQENVLLNEQSLDFVVNNLPDGESRLAAKFFTYKALDLFNYRTMKMYVWGDTTFHYLDEANYDAEVTLRFGLDSLNYYEYRAPLHQGWDALNEVVVQFSDVTALKQGRDSSTALTLPVPVPGGPPGSTYRVLGNPSLTQIVYLAIGVENPAGVGTTQPLRGEVWFNELRVVGVDDTPGWAYRFDGQAKLADFGSVSFNYSRIDPYFHSLEQRFGSRQESKAWGVSASVQVEKLLPDDWVGTSIPISYSHTESALDPRYLPNSDVLVQEAADLRHQQIVDTGGTEEEATSESERILYESQSRRVAETYAAPTFRIGLPSKWWIIRDTFNKLTYGFTYTRSNERAPALVYREAWNWNVRLGYAISLPPENYIAPFRTVFDGVFLLDEYKGFKLNYLPSAFSWNIASTRSKDMSLQRAAGAKEITSRNFNASRGFAYSWKFIENFILDFANDYTLGIESSLLELETDSTGSQRPFSDIMNDIFGGDKLINFGKDIRYSQRNVFTFKPNIPNVLGIKKYMDLSFGYTVDYQWQNTLVKGDVGKSAAFNASTNFTFNFRLKQLFDPLWGDGSAAPATPAQTRGRRGTTGTDRPADQTAPPDTTAPSSGGVFAGLLGGVGTVTRILIKIPFLDYDNISITFNQTNNSQNNGILGSAGFANYWGTLPFSAPDPANGPSRMYQLGLVGDPSGTATNFRFTLSPPFLNWDVTPGPRAPGAVLINTYRQTNRLALKTSRGLWEGAKLDLNWNLGWNYNRTQNIVTDSLYGIPALQNQTTAGSVERSFLSFPDFLIFGLFNTGLEQVSKRYAELKADPGNTKSDDEKLNQAFEEGLEAIPWLKEIFGQYYPRVNWSFRWDGLEKIPLFANFVSRLSLDHAYTSTYNRQYQNRPGGGGERTDAQRVNYGFSPLIGLNFTFKEFLKGNLGANLKYSTTMSYDLATSSRNIIESLTEEISLTASFNRRGFEIPFFGISLSNDVDVSFSYAVAKNSRKTYDVSKIDVSIKGEPLEGTTRTTMEPRIRYVLSSRVTAAIYYRYTKIAPDAQGSRIPGSTTNEAGLDLRISIQ